MIDTCSAYTNFDTVIRVFSDADLTIPLGAQDDTPSVGAPVEACAGGKSQAWVGLPAGTCTILMCRTSIAICVVLELTVVL